MSDIQFTMGVQAGSLKESIEKEIKSATKDQYKIKLKADVDALRKSLASIGNDKNQVRLELGVNKGKFLSAVNDAIRSVSANAKQQVKLQIGIDEGYLKQQVQAALNNLGNFVTKAADGSVGRTITEGAKSVSSAVRAIDLGKSADTSQYNKLIRVMNQVYDMEAKLNTKQSNAGFASSLKSTSAQIEQLAEKARAGKIDIESFRREFQTLQTTTAGLAKDFKSMPNLLTGGTGGSEKGGGSATAEITKQFNLIKQGWSEVMRIQGVIDKSSAAKGSAAYAGLIESRDTIRKATEAVTENAHAYEDCKVKIAGASAESKKYENTIKENGQHINSLSDKMQRFKMNLTTISSLIHAFSMLRMAIRPIVNAVTEVDAALTQLQIVTQANNTEIENYSNNIMKVADRTAGSITDLINSTTTFARLGYNLDDSSKLAEYTQKLENVGDIDEASATNAITAVIKAYDKGADDLEGIMDRMVNVGNHAPIAVKEIAEGMNNAASILAIGTENDFDKSVALLTAANTTMQNISKSSTGLRTIVARIRNVKAELDDLGETMTEVEYNNMVKMLTDNNVSLTNENGELRNTYDILHDLSEAWKDMSANEQAALAKTLSGKLLFVPVCTEMCAAQHI